MTVLVYVMPIYPATGNYDHKTNKINPKQVKKSVRIGVVLSWQMH
jgi:hypothetical protein